MTPQETTAVTEFRDAVAALIGTRGPWSMRLFGSRARHEGTEDSDVDILVLIPEADDTLKVRIWDAAHEIFARTDILLSPLVLSQAQFASLLAHERLIAQEIERDGIPIDESFPNFLQVSPSLEGRGSGGG